MKTLKKSPYNKILGGCLAGIGEYFGWDVTLVRIIFVLITLATGIFTGIIIYTVMFILMPE